MRASRLALTAAATIAALALLPALVGAQSSGAADLLNKANEAYSKNCVDSAMNYYALLQKYPGWLKAADANRAMSRINLCRKGVRGIAGVNGKADSDTRPIPAPPTPPRPIGGVAHVVATPLTTLSDDRSATPRARACRAYAETAVAHSRLIAARQCSGPHPYKVSGYDFHYKWCTERGTPEQAQAYANERARELNSCQLRW